jgi:hypothetical protein
MTFRSHGRTFMSWGLREVGLHEASSDYFDFVTYFGVIILSMGTCEYKPFTKDELGEHAAEHAPEVTESGDGIHSASTATV